MEGYSAGLSTGLAIPDTSNISSQELIEIELCKHQKTEIQITQCLVNLKNKIDHENQTNALCFFGFLGIIILIFILTVLRNKFL